MFAYSSYPSFFFCEFESGYKQKIYKNEKNKKICVSLHDDEDEKRIMKIFFHHCAILSLEKTEEKKNPNKINPLK